MSFERPLFLFLFLLAAPWILWLRRQQPRDYAVGGLGPFRPFAAAGGTRRRGWPFALLCALVALSCAVLALARPSFGSRPEYLILDRSLSVRACGVEEPDAGDRIVLTGEADLLRLVQAVPARARVEVWTDLPAPGGLPDRIRWNDEAFLAYAAPNAALLVARPVAENRWIVHWIAEPGAAPLDLVSDAGDRSALSSGEEGLTEMRVDPAATRLALRAPDGSEPDRRRDHDWSIAPDSWTIPADWDERWEAIAAAAWPGFRIVRAAQVAKPPFAADPFAALSELDAVALLAGELRARADAAQAPRPASECRRPPPAAHWSEGAGSDREPDRPFGNWLGWAGAGFLLLSFLPSVVALSERFGSRRANP